MRKVNPGSFIEIFRVTLRSRRGRRAYEIPSEYQEAYFKSLAWQCKLIWRFAGVRWIDWAKHRLAKIESPYLQNVGT